MRQSKNKIEAKAKQDTVSRENFREALRSFRVSLESLNPDEVPEKYELLREVGRAEKLEKLARRGNQREKALAEIREIFDRLGPTMEKICVRFLGPRPAKGA